MTSSAELILPAEDAAHFPQLVPDIAELVVNVDGGSERDERQQVSLLQTALQHTRGSPTGENGAVDIVEDMSLLQRKKPHMIKVHDNDNDVDDVLFLQMEAIPEQRVTPHPPVRHADWDASKHVGSLPKALKAVHHALSMSPSSVLEASKAKISAKRGHEGLHAAPAGDGSSFVDWLTAKAWSRAAMAQLAAGVLALFFVVAQTLAGDLLDAPLKLKRKKLEDQDNRWAEEKRPSPWVSEEPASLFAAHAGRLCGIAGEGGLAEIRGPLDCPVLHAAVAIEEDGNTFRIGSTSTGAEPLMIVGPVPSAGVPKAVAVHRTSTGAAGSLERLGGGLWALRRDGKVELTIKCDVSAHVIEVFRPVRVLPKITHHAAFEPEEKKQDEEARLREAECCSERLVARSALRRCDRDGEVLDFDILEIAIAVCEEVVMPLTCILAVLLMTPDFMEGAAALVQRWDGSDLSAGEKPNKPSLSTLTCFTG